ncbi:hypothetical protein AX15_004702 [Amanita polypyramis BW_CC]|nr:hypothetical protein AX15_004702 [Amanita polypyramis BW_CC]
MSNSHELVYDTLEANKAHQSALIKYAQALAAEIQELDNFLNTIAVSDASEDNTEQRSTVQIKGASKPTSVIQPSTFLKPDSPFYIEGSRLARYTSYTEPRQMKGKELDALADAVKREGQRLQTLNHPMLLSEQEIQNDELNWTTIAERVSAASGNTRTADECRVKWEAGLLNNGKTTQDGASRPRHIWSVQFDKRLKDAVDRYGFYNWTMGSFSLMPPFMILNARKLQGLSQKTPQLVNVKDVFLEHSIHP